MGAHWRLARDGFCQAQIACSPGVLTAARWQGADLRAYCSACKREMQRRQASTPGYA